MLCYPLFGGKTINRWLTSDIREELVRFEPVTLHGDVNLWMKEGFAVHENPCKTAFVRERKARKIAFADVLSPEERTVSWMGHDSGLVPYFPFGDVSVNFSGFWFVPTYLSTWATTVLKASSAHTASFRLITCGGAVIWVNGARAAELTPFTRNAEDVLCFDVRLESGDNTITVFFDDMAERDTYFFFRLDYLSDGEVTQCVPVHGVNSERILAAEQFLENLRFDKPTYLDGEIRLIAPSQVDFPLQLQLHAAAEENLQSGTARSSGILLPLGCREAVLGRSEDFPCGYLDLGVSCEIETVTIRRPLFLENLPTSLIPHPSSDVAERKNQTIAFLADYGEENINRAVALLHQGRDIHTAEAIIRKQMQGINARYDCSDFFLVYFPWIWKRFQEVLSPELLDEMAACMRDFRYWMDEPGDDVMWFYSENHALMFHTCQLLAGELFPEQVFTNSGMTGIEMQAKAKTLLKVWFESYFATGLTEWNSSAYLPVNALGLGNIYLQSSDGELRGLARKALDELFRVIAISGKDGYLACSAGRIYIKEMLGNYINATTAMSYVGYGAGNLNQSAKGVLSLCLSDYAPPAEYASLLKAPAGTAMEYRVTQGYEKHVTLYSYKTADWLLSSAADFRPGKPGYQEHVLHCAFDPECQLWVNHPGELAVYGCSRPSYWAGNGTLPRVNQHRGYASAFYRIHPDHLVDFTHLYLPENCFDAVRQEGEWLFLQKGGAFGAVYAANGLTPQTEGPFAGREWRSPGRTNHWLLRFAASGEYSCLSDFVGAIRDSLCLSDVEKGEIHFADPRYGRLESGWDKLLTINGEEAVFHTGCGVTGCMRWLDDSTGEEVSPCAQPKN